MSVMEEEEEQRELKPWEIERMKRIQEQEEKEKLEFEAMKLKAQKEREEFYNNLKKKQEETNKNLEKSVSDSPVEDGDVVGGWKKVMDMVEPLRQDIDPKEVRKVKGLFMQMKM